MVKLSGIRQRLLMALVAFSVTACATVIAASSSATPKQSAVADAPTAVAPATEPRQMRIGIAYGDTLVWMSDKDLAAGLDDAVTLGAHWIRVDLSWEDIQPDSADSYQWPRFDRIVNAARARGLDVLPTLGYTPAWARKAGCDSAACAPANPAAFAAFAATAARRYAPQGVHTWEIWNEPNITPFWAPKPDPAGYTQLLRETAQELRSVDPRAYLLMGGLAAVGSNPTTGWMSQTAFLTAVSKLGANHLVDALSYHPYTYPILPSAVTRFGTAYERISSYSDNLVAVLDKYGTPNLPIWITETGAGTNGPGVASDGKTIPPNTTHVTEAFQARIATDTVTATAANSHVTALFWFADRDSGTPAQKASRSLFFGLRRLDGSPKPAFNALREAIAAYEREHH
ncbi:cellulase family glycosylhydrolase [Streptacidiphilus sp. EB129]|uniref:cellulase family glycosylhydrolase n=1 Tax=Streptacidiphilus sp. EB129 TaxID=3156262 RepID=UPI0035194AF2